MREVVVLVENLTDETFQLHDSLTDGNVDGGVPLTFVRSAKLTWRVPDDSVSAAVEYVTRGSGTCLTILVHLPKGGPRWAGKLAQGTPRFFGRIRPTRGDLKQLLSTAGGDFKQLLAGAPVAESGSGKACEWMVLRKDTDGMEIRFRALPDDFGDPTLARKLTFPLEGTEEGTRDDTEVNRLLACRRVQEILHEESVALKTKADEDGVDVERLRKLPEDARFSLLLAVLAALLRRRRFASRWTEGTKSSEEAVHNFTTLLTTHTEEVYRAWVRVVGFEDERTQVQISRMAQTHLGPANELEPPDAHILCAQFNRAVNVHDSAASWSLSRTLQLGPETKIVGLGVPLLDPDLTCSLTDIVEGLNQGRLLCDGDCCLALSDCSWVLFYRGRVTDVFARFTQELATPQPLPDLLSFVTDGIEEVVGAVEGVPVVAVDLSEPESVAKATANGAEEERPTVSGAEEDTLTVAVDVSEGVPAASGTKEETPTVSSAQEETPTIAVDVSDSETMIKAVLSVHSAPGMDVALAQVPRSWLVARDFLALILGCGGGYDARSRAALFELAGWLGVSPRLMALWEAEIGAALFDALESEAVLRKHQAKRNNWHRGKVAAAAVGGGVLLAVTGGLAAPAIAGGITAVGGMATTAGAAVGLAHTGVLVGSAIVGVGAALTSLGTTGAAVLFGATGVGLMGWKLSRRWGDLEEFSFVPVLPGQARTEFAVTLADPGNISRLDEKLGVGVLAEEQVMTDTFGGSVVVFRGSRLTERKTTRLATSAAQTREVAVSYHFERYVDRVQRAVHLAIFVCGSAKEESDYTRPWTEASVFLPSSGLAALRWEPQQLRQLNDLISQMIKSQVASNAASFWFKSVAVTAGSTAVMSVAWPIWIISSMVNLDNAWLVCIERARMAGTCLAHVLADRHAVGKRPVTLMGHALGARLLFYCLLELYNMGELHVVSDVFLLGTPVQTSPEKWRKLRSVVAGRLVNAYNSSDWLLAFLYRYLEWGVSVAGLSDVRVPGVENIDLRGLGISGLNDYVNHMPKIFAKLRVGAWCAPIIPRESDSS